MNFGWYEPFHIKGVISGHIFRTSWVWPPNKKDTCLIFLGNDETVLEAKTRKILAELK